MSHILVTGGAGRLGRELTPRLQQVGHRVWVMSRRPRPADLSSDLEWAQANIETGTGLREAVSGMETIIHAASNPLKRTRQVDVDGTRRLLEVARAAGVGHFIHVSIVGIERIPYPYYQVKVAAEAVVREGGVPYTILRATQFHTLLDMFLSPLRNWPLAFTFTDFKFQPIDTGEVADRLCALVGQPPAGLLPDMGGPEVLTLGEMASDWFAAQGKRTRLFRLPLPGAIAHGFRNGYNTCPDHCDGKITWAEWVRRKYSKTGIHE
jgi:uncharacterized protein YbjT (DUF2867 family)